MNGDRYLSRKKIFVQKNRYCKLKSDFKVFLRHMKESNIHSPALFNLLKVLQKVILKMLDKTSHLILP